MRTEDKICTQVQAIRLAGYGVNCQSLFRWEIKEGGIADFHWNLNAEDSLPAYDVAELGLMTPRWGWFRDWPTKVDDLTWNVYLSDADVKEHEFETEAQARAACLIHLLEMGKIIPDQVNSHL